MHDVFLARPVAAVQAIVDELGIRISTAQVLETDLVDVDGDELLGIVATYTEAVIGHITEVGRTVDVVHLHPAQFTGGGVAVHLARMRHEDDQAFVLHGEAAQLASVPSAPAPIVGPDGSAGR